MSVQLVSHHGQIVTGEGMPRVASSCDDHGAKKIHRRKAPVDPELQHTLTCTMIMVFLLAAGVFFVTMSFTLLDLRAALEPLQLAKENQIFSELSRIENSAVFAFAGASLGFAVLAAWGSRYLSRKISR
jgi:hypothetical protein